MTEVAQESNTVSTEIQNSKEKSQNPVTVVKGKPVSGRVWKREKNKYDYIY